MYYNEECIIKVRIKKRNELSIMSKKGKFWVVFVVVTMVITLATIFTNWINPFVSDIGVFMGIVLIIRMMYILYIQRKKEVRTE